MDEKNEQLPESLGDYGGGISANRDSIETTRLIERAVKNRWPIDEKYKQAVVNRQVQIAIDKQSSNREAISAAKCLVSMEGQNQKDQIDSEQTGGDTFQQFNMTITPEDQQKFYEAAINSKPSEE